MLLAELDENKEAIRHYIPGNEYIGVDNSYYLTDEQGSVRYVLSADAKADVQNIYQYDAFGECTAREERIPNRLKYNAQIEDELTGLYYLRARYCNASIGRFTQEDVIYNDGLNLYAYCGSNPVMYCDPSGFAKGGCDPKIGGEKGSESGNTTKPNQVHHFATNKSKKYTSQFESITKKYGLDLDGDWNKQSMPHQGRHPYAYHDYVLDNMQKFDRIANGDKTKFLKLYDQMKQKIINNPEMLYKDYWNK